MSGDSRIGQAAAMRLLPFVIPLMLLALWQASASLGWVSRLILPPPGRVVRTFAELLQDGGIASAFVISLRRIATGFATGAAAGIALGILLGLIPRFDRLVGPTFRALAQVPTIGWMPILILVLGLNEMVKYIIIAKASFLMVLIATADGIRNIPLNQIEAMRVLRLRRSTALLRFWLPSALPPIVTGLRLGLGAAWIALIIVEMLASAEGIGYMMVWGRLVFQLDVVIVGMIIIGISGLALDQAMALAERRLLRHRELRHG